MGVFSGFCLQNVERDEVVGRVTPCAPPPVAAEVTRRIGFFILHSSFCLQNVERDEVVGRVTPCAPRPVAAEVTRRIGFFILHSPFCLGPEADWLSPEF
jgi:hypothetical protein